MSKLQGSFTAMITPMNGDGSIDYDGFRKNVMFQLEQGIDGNRLTATGLGMTMPIADNSTKEGRQKNRRVDLVIQDKALQQPAEAAPAAVPAAAPEAAPAAVPAAEAPKAEPAPAPAKK